MLVAGPDVGEARGLGQAIAITDLDHTAAELRHVVARTKDGQVVRRLLALLLEGKSRTEAARWSGMQRRTLRDWVHRYSTEGIAGLKSRLSPGPAPLLTAQQMAELKELVVGGPDPEQGRVVRWRCVDLRAQISVTVHERTVGKLLRKLGLTRLQPRPYHSRKEDAAQETFKKRMARPPFASVF